MKKDTHPEYKKVVFIDTQTGMRFLCGSTVKTAGTEEYEGKQYPAYRCPITSDSHPYYKGEGQVIDTGGRISRFNQRYNKAK